jgi:hypothetical protein
MATAFIPFWQLRRHAVAEETVRGGSRRRRTDAPWPLAADLRERLRPLLESAGLDAARDVTVSETAHEDGFHLSQ